MRTHTMGLLTLLSILPCLSAQDYKAVSGGAPPARLSAEVRQVLQSRGVKVMDPNGFLFCEVWLRSGRVAEDASLPAALQADSIPAGALVGAVRYASPGADRHGRGFGPGVYTLRHAGGDTVMMVKADDDPGPDPVSVDSLEEPSRTVTRTDSPALLRLAHGGSGSSPRLRITRDGEWILQVAVGGTPVSLLVVGVAK